MDFEVTLKRFRFDLNKEDEAAEYEELCENLKGVGYKLFEAFGDDKNTSNIFHIDPKHLFNNQYNTVEGDRIFEWREYYYINNSMIKSGYYIQYDNTMSQIQKMKKERLCCSYCGTQYTVNSEDGFCHKCTGTEYLEEKDYQLLFLTSVFDKDTFNFEKVKIPQSLLTEISYKQKEFRLQKIEKEKSDFQEKMKKKLLNAEKEFKGYEWLIEHNLDYKNVIFYDHKDHFCFGWKEKIEDKESLHQKLKEFPFNYEIR